MQSMLSRAAAALALVLPVGASHASCGSAFCSVNTSWDVQSASTEPGVRLDLRYEYINQDQLRSGKDKVSPGQIAREHEELRTVNRNWIGSFDCVFNHEWGMTAIVPFVDRRHDHVFNDPDTGTQTPESWKFTDPGDVRLLGRWQTGTQHTADAVRHDHWGVQFGLKLPTGKRDVADSSGERAERTLQPGTGTTDALLGAYYGSSLPQSSLSWFAQAHWQQALNTREDYKPGSRVNVDLGMRYQASDRLGLMLQLNTLFRGRDSGAQAEAEDSGGRSVFLSPGIGYTVAKDLQVYAFVQLPLYQYVNGVQLTADRAFVAGISSRF